MPTILALVLVAIQDFTVVQTKRLRRAAKFMKDPDAVFWMLLTLIVLCPLHALMATHFRSTGAENSSTCMISETKQAINVCVTSLCQLLFEPLSVNSVRWCALCGLVAVTQAKRVLIRREVLRVLGGTVLRQVERFTDPLVSLLEAFGDPSLSAQELQSACNKAFNARPCCRCHSLKRLIQIHKNAVLATSNLGKKAMVRAAVAWLPSILMAERSHSGSKHRVSIKRGKTRRWRRQIAQYILDCMRTIYAASEQGKSMLGTLTGRTWSNFFQRVKKKKKRCGVGSNGKRHCINNKSEELRNLGFRKEQFDTLRDTWAKHYDNDMTQEEKNDVLADFNCQRKLKKNEVRIARESDSANVTSTYAGRQHWKMASNFYPVAVEVYKLWASEKRSAENLAERSRGGLRALANACLPEKSFVDKPLGRKLKLDEEGKSCLQKHKGFCVDVDVGMADAFGGALATIKAHEGKDAAGCAVWRYLAADNADLFVIHAAYVGNPRYASVYFVCEISDGNPDHPPYELKIKGVDEPALKLSGGGEIGSSIEYLLSSQLAARVMRMMQPVAMLKVEHTVGETSADIIVSGTELICHIEESLRGMKRKREEENKKRGAQRGEREGRRGSSVCWPCQASATSQSQTKAWAAWQQRGE